MKDLYYFIKALFNTPKEEEEEILDHELWIDTLVTEAEKINKKREIARAAHEMYSYYIKGLTPTEALSSYLEKHK